MDSTKQWISERIVQDEIDKYMERGKDFIPHLEILEKLKTPSTDPAHIRNILAKALEIKSLTPDEVSSLIAVEDPELLNEMQETAFKIKQKVYDKRIITFAPLYMGNECVNSCVYCGFRTENHEMKRHILSLEEIQKEVAVLAGQIGHKRLILVYGEHPQMGVDYIVDSMQAVYDVKIPVKNNIGNIRRVNVNAAPMSVAELKRINEAGLGTFQVFQETYHRSTYEKLHPQGTLKGNYHWRLYAMHRAMEAGIDDVGIGALFGLYDWRYEVMAMVYHGIELEKKFGIGPHTVSFPRIEPAHNTPYTDRAQYKVSDEDFKKIIMLIRLAMPYTGMIITARESAQIRREAISLGITQMDASTQIGVGDYAKGNHGQKGDQQQFYLGDTRSLEELIKEFTEMGFLTSFCTAGYRCGRTGKCIMDLLRSGTEGKFCKVNAVLTFREWLDDFAGPWPKDEAHAVLEKEIEEIKQQMPHLYPKFIEAYEKVKAGDRDLFF